MFAVCSAAHATVGRRDIGASCAPDSRAATAQTLVAVTERGPAEDRSRSDDAGFVIWLLAASSRAGRFRP
jgi:hypothetical protein